MALSPLWLAFRVVADGLSANAGLRMAKEAGIGVRRQTFLRMVGEVRNNYAQRIAELDRPLAARARPDERAKIPTRNQSGFIHYIDVYVRNRDTGAITVRPQAIRSNTLLSRDAAVDRAVNQYRTAVDRSKVTPAQWGTDPRETVEGGIYTATHEFDPIYE